MSKRKGNAVSKFLKIFLLTFLMLCILLGVGVFAYYQVSSGNTRTGVVTDDNKNNEGKKEGIGRESGTKNEEKISTFAVFGVDKDGFRTDVIMLVLFNTETKRIDVVSVPRDTKIKIPDELYTEMKSRRSNLDQFIKVNEVSAYANHNMRYQSTVAVLEKSFGIDVDYYVKMDLNGFRSIVDIIGPITVDIPKPMKYSDPHQDLYINLDQGVQPINGAQAESLIRYRSGYANGDLGRIEMQKEFMKAFLKELLTLENRINIVNIAASAMVYVETDFMNSVDYLAYIDDIKTENIHFATIPGEAVFAKRAYYVYDIDETKKLLNEIINGPKETAVTVAEEEVIEPEVVLDARQLTISVQNGTNISRLAGRTKERLTSNGFNVMEAVDYKGDDVITQTIITVPTKEVGSEIADQFKNPKIEVKSDLIDTEIQIIIVLGPEEGGN